MSELPVPYPADTRAKGWRFELDHERIRQSDTWALAPADMKPWLLMLWMTAWEQMPCGSLPAEDELIAARIGMPAKLFTKHRSVLLRGWWKANDGRLYHNIIAQRVIEMLAIKDKERARKAAYRQRMDAERTRESYEVPSLSHGTDDGQPRDSHGSDTGRDDTGTGTGTSLKEPPIPPKGGNCEETVSGKPAKKAALSLKAFLESCKEFGEKPIPESDPVFLYAEEAGIPVEFLRLHWLEFKARYCQPDAKRYKDWRSVYRRSVRSNWFRVWYLKADGSCGLTTVGEQAKRIHEREAA